MTPEVKGARVGPVTPRDIKGKEEEAQGRLFKGRLISLGDIKKKLFRDRSPISHPSSAKADSSSTLHLKQNQVQKALDSGGLAKGIIYGASVQKGAIALELTASEGAPSQLFHSSNAPISEEKGGLDPQMFKDLKRMKYVLADEGKGYKFSLPKSNSTPPSYGKNSDLTKPFRKIEDTMRSRDNFLMRRISQHEAKAKDPSLSQEDRQRFTEKISQLKSERDLIASMMNKKREAEKEFVKESGSYWTGEAKDTKAWESSYIKLNQIGDEMLTYAQRECGMDKHDAAEINSSFEKMLCYVLNPRDRLKQMQDTMGKTIDDLNTMIDIAKGIGGKNLAPTVKKLEAYKAEAERLKTADQAFQNLSMDEEIEATNSLLRESDRFLVENIAGGVFGCSNGDDLSCKEAIACEFFAGLSDSKESAKYISSIAQQGVMAVPLSLAAGAAGAIAGDIEERTGEPTFIKVGNTGVERDTISICKKEDGSIQIDGAATISLENPNLTTPRIDAPGTKSFLKMRVDIPKDKIEDMISPLEDGRWKINEDAVAFDCQSNLYIDADKI